MQHVLRHIFLMLLVGVAVFSGKADAQFIPYIVECQYIGSLYQLNACHQAINTPDEQHTTICGPLNFANIMADVQKKFMKDNVNAATGEAFRQIADLVLDQCSYGDQAQKAFLHLEEILGVRASREMAQRSQAKTRCIGAVRKRMQEQSDEKTNIEFVVFISKTKFGGGMSGDMKAIKYLEALAADKIEQHKQEFIANSIKHCL